MKTTFQVVFFSGISSAELQNCRWERWIGAISVKSLGASCTFAGRSEKAPLFRGTKCIFAGHRHHIHQITATASTKSPPPNRQLSVISISPVTRAPEAKMLNQPEHIVAYCSALWLVETVSCLCHNRLTSEELNDGRWGSLCYILAKKFVKFANNKTAR